MKMELPLQQDCQTPEDTTKLAQQFVELLKPGDVIAFYGDLGAGKTFFVQQICQSLNCDHPATSPTFTIMNQYQADSGLPVYHFDFYRLQHQAEMVNLGFDEYFYGDGVCLIEWADRVETFLPLPRYRIDIKHLPEDGGRSIRIVLQV